jgi:hypothetical protein
MTFIGQVAGGFKGRYFNVQVQNKKYRCHRLVCLLNGISLTEKDKVDHIDRDTKNNKVSNLKVCSQKTNSENRGMSSANTSGTTGVSIMQKSSITYCVAHWKINRKGVSRWFSVKKMGLLPAFKAAVDCRLENIKLLNLSGANYTENHGKN